MKARKTLMVVATTGSLAVIVATAGAMWLGANPGTADPPLSAPLDVATTAVTTGDVVQESTQQGVLAFSDAQPIVTRRAGTVTALPAEATVLAPGAALYAVDAQPIVLLRGSVPSWRDFSAGMPDGDDVLQLEQNLLDMGVFTGDIDRSFTRATTRAVEAWQKSMKMEATGTLAASSILFSPTDIRVDRLEVRLGAPVGDGTAIFTGTSTIKTVTVELRLRDQQLAEVGAEVTIVLPDNAEISGTVTAVGQPRQASAEKTEDTVATVVPVIITPTDQSTTGPFGRADVTVRFPSAIQKDAMTVPVDALIATGPDTFGVQVLSAKEALTTVPVTLGVFEAGRVQITGEGIAAGTRVVIP